MSDIITMLEKLGDWAWDGILELTLHLLLLGVLSVVPLLILARRRIYPHVSLLFVFLVPCFASLLLIVLPEQFIWVFAVDATVLGVACYDLATLPARRYLSVSRTMQRVASLNKPHAVELTVVHSRPRSRQLTLAIRDDIPQEFEAIPPELVVRMTGRCRAHLQYKLVARRRGAFSLHAVHMRISSRFLFWKRYYSLPEESVVHVYPDMVQLAEYAVLARTNRLSLLGVRRSRKVGQDHDFERLRDYSLDDNYKHIDWRATARRNRLTVKDYQTSQSQRIVFLLDCGRMMNNEAKGIHLLDHALNASLMLAYVALRQGDSVGLVCFSDRIHNSVPVRGGLSQMNHLLHACFDRFPQMVESRYDLAFMHLASHFRKRALVVLVSNLIDDVNGFQVRRYLRAQVGRHLPLGVLLRDHQLFDVADCQPLEGRNVFRAAAASEIINWRHEIITDLQHQGVLMLDVYPENMTAPLVNQYLQIKARHLL